MHEFEATSPEGKCRLRALFVFHSCILGNLTTRGQWYFALPT